MNLPEIPLGQWFTDILMSISPDPERIRVDGMPVDMTDHASNRAFSLSFASGMLPGPVGMATILPELAAVTRIQMELIYKIAKYHGKLGKADQTMILYIFACALGVAAGRLMVEKAGSRLVIKVLSTEAARRLAASIGGRIGVRFVQRSAGRWICLATAPLFAYFSKRMTEKIGWLADDLFRHDIEQAIHPAGKR